MQLPADLTAALERELKGTSTRQIASAARTVSRRYRDRPCLPDAPFLSSEADVAAYAAYRLPATYAAIRAVLEEARSRLPETRVASLIDAGGGPGTATWAATAIWPALESATILERDARMIRLGRSLAAEATSPTIRDATWREIDLTVAWEVAPADVVVAAYVLGELRPDAREGVIREIWEHVGKVCVIVEPGTPPGSESIRDAAVTLAATGAHIVAPYPSEWQCRESAADWSHFAQRVPRAGLHRRAKGASLSYEDEKYAYVVASRAPIRAHIAARVIRQPQVRPGHIRLVLCTAAGINHVVVTRSRGEAYRRAKDLRWGSAILDEEASLFGL